MERTFKLFLAMDIIIAFSHVEQFTELLKLYSACTPLQKSASIYIFFSNENVSHNRYFVLQIKI